jgi:putative spermidine/putrescine transport system substrate-binding protein
MKTIRYHKLLSLLLLLLPIAGCGPALKPQPDPLGMNWGQILEQSKGRGVTLLMWQGDPYINKYMNDYVVPRIKARYGITLTIAPAQGSGIVSLLMKEKEAKKQQSDIDMAWINGETFYQLRQIDDLYGPFVGHLPNARYIDFTNPFIGYDFQQPVAGYECPWGNVQLAIIYNSAKVQSPPKTREELARCVREHPGRFTIGNDFTGMTFLKSLLIDLAGGKESLNGKFDPVKYEKSSKELWEYINNIKPYFWKNGETFPDNVAMMHQLFASGELYFTMSNNDGEVDNKVLQGLFPETSKAYVLDNGTIQNSHYMGIIKNSGNKGAAMVVCNFLISPDAQLEKFNPRIWGDGTVLDLRKLPETYQSKFIALPERKHAPSRAVIQHMALQEPAAEYMTHLFADFRKYVIEKK